MALATGAGDSADAPASHGIGLGDAIDEDRVRLDLVTERGDAGERHAVIYKLVIDLI